MGRQRLLLYHARDLSTAAQPSPSVVDVVDLVKVGWVELVRRDQRRKDALSARDRKRLARKKQSSLLAIEPCKTRGQSSFGHMGSCQFPRQVVRQPWSLTRAVHGVIDSSPLLHDQVDGGLDLGFHPDVEGDHECLGTGCQFLT